MRRAYARHRVAIHALGFNLSPAELPVSTVNGPTLTRRRIATGTAALLAGGTGLVLASDEADAQADVEMGELAIEDGELAPEDSEVFAPWVLVTGSYEYRVQTQPDEWQCYILIGDGSGNQEAVGVTSGAADATEASGSYALRGAVTASSFYVASDFRVPDDEDSISVSVPVEIAFVVRDGDGEMLVQSRASDTAVVTVTHGGATASFSGAGEIVMQDDRSDPTPTEPEP